MKNMRILALTAVAILVAGTMTAEAFERYSYGEFRGGLAENDFFGQPMGNDLPGPSIGSASPGYKSADSYPFYGPIFGSSTPTDTHAQTRTYLYSSTTTPNRSLVVTARSAAIGGFGRFCSTPIKSCLLYEPSMMGIRCSCKMQGGHSYGNVTP
jgi:hypothetical protein